MFEFWKARLMSSEAADSEEPLSKKNGLVPEWKTEAGEDEVEN